MTHEKNEYKECEQHDRNGDHSLEAIGKSSQIIPIQHAWSRVPRFSKTQLCFYCVLLALLLIILFSTKQIDISSHITININTKL